MFEKLRRIPIIRLGLGIVLGAALGYAYYRFVGCATGTCPITKNPWTSMFYGALIGGLLGSSTG